VEKKEKMEAAAVGLARDAAWEFDDSQEQDPNGLAPSDPGAKLDQGKPRAALVLGDFSRALQAVAEVGTYGEVKYSASGWMKVENGEERYNDAAMLHWLKRMGGADRDVESGLLHHAQQAWNVLAELELRLRSGDVHGK